MISINLINYNNGEATKEFVKHLDGLRSGIEEDTEVVVVDNQSQDGSEEPLKEVADHFVTFKSVRGVARDTALWMCNGDITIDCLDTDQRPQPELAKIVNWYSDNFPKYCLNTNGCMVNRYDMAFPLGFGPYQSGEDKHLWDALIERGWYKFLQVNTAKHIIHNHDRSPPFYKPVHQYPQAHRTHRDKGLEREILK